MTIVLLAFLEECSCKKYRHRQFWWLLDRTVYACFWNKNIVVNGYVL